MRHLFRFAVTVWVLGAGFATACVDAIDATTETGQALEAIPPDDFRFRCAGCGANGLHQASWNAMFAEADRNALNNYGAWDESSDGPVSLCAMGSMQPGSCVMRPAWRNWIHASSGRHGDMMVGLVKVIAPGGYAVVDTNENVTYSGAFGLATDALGSSWSHADQESVTAGMLALLDAIHNVPVCLKSERAPNNCATAGPSYHEATFFGSTFRMHYAAISGGAGAPVPTENLRYGTALPSSASTFNWQQGRCATTGTGADTLAAYCNDEHGIRWHWPVVVVTPFAPSTWYYHTGGSALPKPSMVPPANY